MLLRPLLRSVNPLTLSNAASAGIKVLPRETLNTLRAAMSSKQAGSFRTQAMPSIFTKGPASLTGTPSSDACVSNFQWCQFSHNQTRSLLSKHSTSGAGCSSSSSYLRQQTRLLRLNGRGLPFASVSSNYTGSVGQLRWLSSGSSSSSASNGKQQQLQQQEQSIPGIQPNMTDEEIRAAAKAATTPDTFKAGDILASGRYQLMRKLGAGPDGVAEGLGEGRFTTLWVGQDCHTNKQVVLKLVEAGDAVSYVAGTREAALHAMAGQHPNILPLLDAFEHRSAAGRHACLVLEKAGSNLLVVIEKHRLNGMGCLFASPEGVEAVRSISRQLLTGLHHLHSRGILHMDLSTDNILIDRPFVTVTELAAQQKGLNWWKFAGHMANVKLFKSQASVEALQKFVNEALHQQQQFHIFRTLRDATVKLTDFGRAVLYKQSHLDHTGALSHSTRDGPVIMGDPGLRPPEEILGMEYKAPAYDIWRAACVLYEVAVGMPMFDVQDWAEQRQRHQRAKYFGDDAIHLMEMQANFGMLPREFIRRSPIFDSLFLKHNDALRLSNVYEFQPNCRSIAKVLEASTLKQADPEQIRLYSDFLNHMLVYDPLKRPSAEDMLQHKFLKQDDQAHHQQQQQVPSR